MLRAGVAILSLLAADRRAGAANTASPNSAIAKPACDVNTTILLRYSWSLERLYLESGDDTTRGGCVTLTKIWEELAGRAPLYAVNASGDVVDVVTGTWLLTESMYVTDGITLQVRYTRRDQCRRRLTLCARMPVGNGLTNVCWRGNNFSAGISRESQLP